MTDVGHYFPSHCGPFKRPLGGVTPLSIIIVTIIMKVSIIISVIVIVINVSIFIII